MQALSLKQSSSLGGYVADAKTKTNFSADVNPKLFLEVQDLSNENLQILEGVLKLERNATIIGSK